jgi:hypothetical protein
MRERGGARGTGISLPARTRVLPDPSPPPSLPPGWRAHLRLPRLEPLSRTHPPGPLCPPLPPTSRPVPEYFQALYSVDGTASLTLFPLPLGGCRPPRAGVRILRYGSRKVKTLKINKTLTLNPNPKP